MSRSFPTGSTGTLLISPYAAMPNAGDQMAVYTRFLLRGWVSNVRFITRRDANPAAWGITQPTTTGLIAFAAGWTGAVGSWTVPFTAYNQWHDMLWVYDYSNVSATPICYIDGLPVAVTVVGAPPSGTPNASVVQGVYVGNRATGLAPLNGSISELAFWKGRLLTQADARLITEYGSIAVPRSRTGRWQLEGGSADVFRNMDADGGLMTTVAKTQAGPKSVPRGVKRRLILTYGKTSVANNPPTAAISAPANSSTSAFGASVAFAGTGTDIEDGTLTGASLQWTSSRDGNIGSGTSFSTTSLSSGTHTITLTATDSLGATGTASITITVTGVASGVGTLTPSGTGAAAAALVASELGTLTLTGASLAYELHGAYFVHVVVPSPQRRRRLPPMANRSALLAVPRRQAATGPVAQGLGTLTFAGTSSAGTKLSAIALGTWTPAGAASGTGALAATASGAAVVAGSALAALQVLASGLGASVLTGAALGIQGGIVVQFALSPTRVIVPPDPTLVTVP